MYWLVCEPLKELNHPRVPAGDVARQLLEHGRRAFAPPVRDGVGDLGARADGARGHAVQRPVADQVADVGRHPLGAGLDELIVVELVEILAQHRDLFGDDAAQRFERLALLRVANAVKRRQQIIKFFRFGIHWIAFNWLSDDFIEQQQFRRRDNTVGAHGRTVGDRARLPRRCRRVVAIEFVDINRDDAGNGLNRRDRFAQRHRLAEGARVE